MKIKKFDQTIHDACDPLARKVVSNWMSQRCGIDCFPNDDGKDTLTRTFKILPSCEMLSSGKFKGLF